jgi:anti-sigma B factor antagonist
MKLQAYTRLDRGVAVIEFDGQITLGDGSGVLRDAVTRVIMDGHKNILLDLEGVSYIDSAGLGELVGSKTLAKAHGADIRLVHLQKKIQGLLQITKLITLFDTYDDEEVAVRSFPRADSAQG